MIQIDVLIPACNEELFIQETLISLQQALERASKKFSFSFNLIVGCNGCQDRTAELAKPLADQVYDWPALGKWDTLKKLSLASTADYLIFVDAGASWHPELFGENIWRYLTNENSLGVAISYNPGNLGIIEKTYWNIESAFKKIELYMGGLVAVSGVSVFYKASAVKNAFLFLDEKFPQLNWLNDDVVLPLTMRFLAPDKIIYLSVTPLELKGAVQDLGLAKASSEWARRQRMMRGNIQWIQNLVPLFFNEAYSSPARQKVFFILMRRLLKVFWAYFVVFFAAVVTIHAFDMTLFTILLGFLALGSLYKPKTIKKLIYAFTASLMAPIDLFLWKSDSKSSWN